MVCEQYAAATGPIDVVIPWVDGSDPAWRAAFLGACNVHGCNGLSPIDPPLSGVTTGGARRGASSGETAPQFIDDQVVATGGAENASAIRYRDWGTLKYLLRGIERFAPWVRTVHLVTWGHLPEWLNVSELCGDLSPESSLNEPLLLATSAPSRGGGGSHKEARGGGGSHKETRATGQDAHSGKPRLNIVRHDDYIPAEYLPTFSSRAIELNVHRISGLSDRFILFNDDMLLLRPVTRERFFGPDGLPRDMARLSLIAPSSISHTVLNMVEILNRRHDRRSVMRSHPWKWFSPRYGLGNLLKTIDLSVWRGFAGLTDTHQPQPYLRATFERMWDEEFAVLDATCRQPFRSPLGVNHWLMRYEQLARGDFSPVSFRDARLDTLSEERVGDIAAYIRSRRYSMVCLNDNSQIVDFQHVHSQLLDALEAILPEKSSYEK